MKLVDLVARGVAWLLSQFRYADNLNDFVGACIDELQEIEASLVSYLQDKNLYDEGSDSFSGAGVILDLWGAAAGEKRGTLDDANYLRFILARFMRIVSSGSIDELVDITQRLTGTVDVHLREVFPALIQVTFTGGSLGALQVGELSEILEDAAAAGVKVGVIQSTSNSFKLDSATRGLDNGLLSRLV